jgi:hypothetical protein
MLVSFVGRRYRKDATRLVRSGLLLVLVALGVVGASIIVPGIQVARADTISYSGSLTAASPSFNSPDASNNPCSGTATVVSPPLIFFYQAQSFSVSASGTYILTNLSNTFVDQDSLFLL